MDNIKLLKYCIKNPEGFMDKNYMFIKSDPKLNTYKKKTKEIKELLIAIKKVKSKKNVQDTLNQLFEELQNKLKKDANYSEFGCFINACDSYMQEVINNLSLLKKVTDLYLNKRTLNDIVPSEWIQAIIDKGSSRKKGHVGEDKLINILKDKKFVFIKKFSDFKKYKKCVAKFSKSGDFSNKNIKKNLKISFGKGTQGKTLDLIIKDNKDIYFLEAKHLNTSGGEQNKQVLELIKIINRKPFLKNYHFVAFLDGRYSNVVLNVGKKDENSLKNKNRKKLKKQELQYSDTKEALLRNEGNYWVNTSGFDKLFSK